jgi:hypothetical protein
MTYPNNRCVILKNLPIFQALLLYTLILPEVVFINDEIRSEDDDCILQLAWLGSKEIFNFAMLIFLVVFFILKGLEVIGQVETFEYSLASIQFSHY